MRISLLFFLLIAVLRSHSQKTLPEVYGSAPHKKIFGDSSLLIDKTVNKKWFLTSYNGVGLSFNFFNGGGATIIDAPVGLQLNRRLNNNLYAFAGVTAAPAYINFNRAFLSPGTNKLSRVNGFKSNSFSWDSRADLGLMYVNDARTFSISGSIGVESSNNPIFLYQQRRDPASNPFIVPNRK